MGLGFFSGVLDIRCLSSAVSNFASNSKGHQGALLTLGGLGFFKEVFFAPWNINGEDYSSAFVHEIFHDPWENLLRYQPEHTWVHQHLWQGYSAPICVTETLDTCNKYYTFSRTNFAPSNLMDAFIFYSTHLLVRRTWLYFPWVLSGHHWNLEVEQSVPSNQENQ